MIRSATRAGTGTSVASARALHRACSIYRHLACLRLTQTAGIVVTSATLLLTACADGGDNSPGSSNILNEYSVGMTMRTFIDTSRVTAAHDTVPEANSRTLETTIVYPARGMAGEPIALDVRVNKSGARFPLMILGHGLGGSVEGLLPLAQVWASKGYVVALPRFPLTNISTPGGPVGEDVQSQPADVSFIIDEVLAESDSSGMLLSKSISSDKIAVGGHSNGGITTYGLTAHSCCRDQRIGAAIVIAGALSPFTGGEYNLADTPPMLLVHGVKDALIIYNSAVRMYNSLLPPKGLLTLEDSNHASFFNRDDPAFKVFAMTTVDFLNSQLRDDGVATKRLPDYVLPGLATMHWAPDEATNMPVEELPEPETNRQAFISADTDLTDGQIITVTWSGFLPGKTVNILQCAGDGTAGAASCNISGGRILQPNPEGMGSLELEINIGPIGNGICDSTNPCTVIVNDAGLTDEDAIIRIPITLAP